MAVVRLETKEGVYYGKAAGFKVCFSWKAQLEWPATGHQEIAMGMSCDANSEQFPYLGGPLKTPYEELGILKKEVRSLVGQVAADGSLARAVATQLEDRLHQIQIRLNPPER